MTLEAIKYTDGRLEVLDQLLLPHRCIYIPVENVRDAWRVVNKMHVRGAPAIAIVGALSLAVELKSMEFSCWSDLEKYICESLDYLISARPTAVNMSTTSQHLRRYFQTKSEICSDVSLLKTQFIGEIESLFDADVEINCAIGRYGAEHILKHSKNADQPVSILTHCNTGSLATAGYGTALGIVRRLHDMARLNTAYFTETRPYLQGARLTAFELAHDNIPGVMICDSAATALLSASCAVTRADNSTLRSVQAVVVGADRVAANGDTANKIGTLQLAVAAAHYHVPFYVAAPISSIDFSVQSGNSIVIEERAASEMLFCGSSTGGVWSDEMTDSSSSVSTWNPAFDVTPACLISGGIVTEKGVMPADKISQLSMDQ